MNFGISTSCLYPMKTEESLELLCKGGIERCEVFLNSAEETTPQFAKKLKNIADAHSVNIVSAHPFSSFSETFMLFSEYERRFWETLDFYKRFFETSSVMGADIAVIHGSLLPAKISKEEYFERFFKLIEAGKEFGIRVAPENVRKHLNESPEFLKEMKKALGEDFKLAFDIKQSVLAGYNPVEFAKTFADDIIHIHISDHNAESACLPPSKGCFDFKKLFSVMNEANYNGNYIIELYRHDFGDPAELFDALSFVRNL